MSDVCLLDRNALPACDLPAAHVVCSDRILLDRFVRTRDEAAFAQLVARHGPLVMGICRRALVNTHDSEDAFQATFLVLARKAASVRRTGSLGSWLYKVAYRTSLRARAMICRRREQEFLDDVAADFETFEEVARRDAQNVLDEELSRLPEKYRSPIVMCHLAGMTRDEAARELGWSPGAVKGRLERGRQRLRMRLALRGVTFSVAILAAGQCQQAAAATVSSSLIASTAAAGVRFATGQSLAGTVSSHVITLAEGVVSAMSITTVKCAVVLLLFAALATQGAQHLPQSTAAGQADAARAGITLQTTLDTSVEEPVPVVLAAVFPPLTSLLAAEGGGQGRGRPDQYANFKSADQSQNTILVKCHIEGEGPQEKTYEVARDARVMVDNDQKATLADLHEGNNLQIWFSADKTKIVALLATGKPWGRYRGRDPGNDIKGLDVAKRTVTFSVGGEGRQDVDVTFKVTATAKITSGRESIKLEDLSVGERVIVRLSVDGVNVCELNRTGVGREE